MQGVNSATDQAFAGRFERPGRESDERDAVGFRRPDGSGRRPSDAGEVYPEAVVASSRDLDWRHIRVLKMCHTGGELVVPPLEHHAIVVHLRPSVDVRRRIGGRELDGRVRPGEVTIVPAGDESEWCWDADQSVHALHLYLHPSFLRSAAAACGLQPNLIAIEPQSGIRDAQIRYLAMSLLHEMGEASVVGNVYAESLATVLAMRLVRHYSCVRDVRVRKGGMAPGKLRRALEFINEKLEDEDEFSLADVAEAVRVSYNHFFRAFKQSMGLSPNQYIVERRVERAKGLLTETQMPIADISFRVGFSSQSHFTSTFRRMTGATPRVYRATL